MDCVSFAHRLSNRRSLALFGGFGIPIYSLCLAAANDDLPPGRLLGTARGLLLLNGIGTAAGPLVGGVVMDRVGPGGLFVYAAVLLTMLAVLAGLRGRSRSAIEVKATRCPNTPMITASLDAMIRTQDEPQSVRN